MTFEETQKIVMTMMALYPQTYRSYTDEQTLTVIQAWSMVFDDIPYEEVSNALMSFYKQSEKGFPPVPGELRKIVFDAHKAKTGTQTMTAMQAWDIVRPRLSKTAWDDENIQFNTLPPLIKQAIGSASTMRSWGQLPSDTVGTVIMSQFVRSYNAQAERQEQAERTDYKLLIGDTEHMKLLEELRGIE